MPSASSATHDASAARPPSSASMPALSSLQHASSSRNDADGSLPGHGLEFIANHHRQHNLNDPALKANPVKSRRSSLLPSVLKPKFKSESRRSLKPPLRSSTSAAAAPLQPRSSSRSVHNYSQSLPSFAAATVPRPRLDANMYEPSVCDPNTAQHHRSNAQRSAPGAHPGPDIADGMEAKASVFRPAYSPSTALLSSPVDQPEADGSICSSIHAKGLTFASMQVIPPASSSPTSFDSTSAPNTHSASRRQPLRNAAFVEEDFAGSETPIDNCIDSPAASQGHADPSEQSNDVSSVTAAAYPTPQPASNPAPPIITRTDVSDDNVSHQVEIASSPDLVAASFTPSVTPPSISTLGASASETSLYPPIQRLPQSASAPVISPRRFSSLGFASANNLANQTDPQSSSSASRTAARDVTEELDSPNSRESRSVRADRRMSMLDFLAAGPSADASPRRIQASLSAEDLSRSAHDTSSLRVRPSALTPPSVPLFQASRQFRLGATAMQARAPVSKTFDLCDQVRVSVEPLVDRLNMFGSMQSSSNYSLAGSVVVEIPRLNIPRLSTAAGLALDGSTTESPSVHVESLTVRFMGYSIYVDATGRYNAIKLTETFQELLPPEGHSCIVELNETATSTVQIASNEDDHQNLKYETEFDLSVPGWLPASQRSRFGATFYCVQATAIVQGQAVLSALSGFDGEFSQTSPSQSSPLSPPESLESELRETSMGTGAGSLRDANFATPATIGRSKSRKTWLNKTARQLQLRTSKKTTGTHSEQGGSASNSRRGSGSKDALQILDRQDPLFGKTTEVSNQVMPTDSLGSLQPAN
ncbi:hypothetical protein PSEUBRA_000947 [Kalmanozyma brasiliensis GHG001]|uniref:uncharacterized protein n=1 Tax=Kalmanozyma brasiliensis (strain GHG001) TaxID=1365824 RepID=UPI001CE799ED|nr:uncharacterized protein PSEUBRA_000947 [Kalmanozyma brasiliensis GHG001]EST09353.2 hypothetical protein PSEUBRA_000947 [Kalmanozyma brasiliensis GHG001]